MSAKASQAVGAELVPRDTRPPYSTRELQAAAVAHLRTDPVGQPCSDTAPAPAPCRAASPTVHLSWPDHPTTYLSDDLPAYTPSPGQGTPAAVRATVVDISGDHGGHAPPETTPVLVVVRAAHAGAGASTIALAVADAAATAGLTTRLLDAASPHWSGLLGAAVTELGADRGWIRGRRGERLVVDRPAENQPSPDSVPPPRAITGMSMTVLDPGWTPRELAAATHGWLTSVRPTVEVLVTRVGTTALAQAELAAATADPDATILVALGATRRTRDRLPDAGPRVRRLWQQQAVLFAPLLSARAFPGIGPHPLPRPLRRTGQRLLDDVISHTGRL